MIIRLLSIAALALALGACASGPTELDRLQRAESERLLAVYHSTRDATREHLAAFQQEPVGACQSPHLARASSEVKAALEPAVAAAYRNLIAVLTLDVADAAADAGCREQARDLYRHVIANSSGTARDDWRRGILRGEYRERAELGIAEMQALSPQHQEQFRQRRKAERDRRLAAAQQHSPPPQRESRQADGLNPVVKLAYDMADLSGPIAVQSDACGYWDYDYWLYKVIRAQVKLNIPDLGERFRLAAKKKLDDEIANPSETTPCGGFLQNFALEQLVQWEQLADLR